MGVARPRSQRSNGGEGIPAGGGARITPRNRSPSQMEQRAAERRDARSAPSAVRASLPPAQVMRVQLVVNQSSHV